LVFTWHDNRTVLIKNRTKKSRKRTTHFYPCIRTIYQISSLYFRYCYELSFIVLSRKLIILKARAGYDKKGLKPPYRLNNRIQEKRTNDYGSGLMQGHVTQK